MGCLRSALCVLLAGSLSAQESPVEVQDLLGVPSSFAQPDASCLVLRSPPGWWSFANMRDGGERQPRHVVSGEGHLLEWGRESVSLPPSRPYLSADALGQVLGALFPDADLALRTARIGERILVSSPAAEQLTAGLRLVRRALPPRVHLALRLEHVAGGDVTVLLAATTSFANGEVVAIGDVERSSAVVDCHVEIAMAAATANPVVVETTHGISALVRVRALPGCDDAVVELVARRAAPFEAPKIPGSSVIGAFDRIANRIDEAGLSFRVARGSPTTHEWTTLGGNRLRLTCAVGWRDEAAGAMAPVLCTPLLAAPVLGFRSAGLEPEELRECFAARALVEHELELRADEQPVTLVEVDERGERGAVLVAPGEAGAALVQRVVGRIVAMLEPAQLVIEAWDVPAGAAEGGAKPDIQAGGPVLVGLPSCFASARERTYVMDWDVEVAQAARIADPKIALSEEGWFATTKLLPAGAGQPRRVELKLDVIRFVELREEQLKISDYMTGSTSDAKVVLPSEQVMIERAVTRATALGAMLDLDANGQAELRCAAAGLLGPGRELMVRVRVE